MQAVIFDMDGTLIDTERVSQASWRRAARDFNICLLYTSDAADE